MKTFANKTLFALFFLCGSLFLWSALAATAQSPAPRSQQTPEAKAQPSIEVKESDYNFGQVMEGASEVEHEFTVKNTGKEVLKIERVQTG
jgi:hypothetical protein